MIHSGRKGMKLLGSYYLTYAAVLLIPIAAACICYSVALRTIRSDIETENQVLLQQAGAILDVQMQELDAFGTQMANNQVISSLRSVEKPLEYPNIQSYFRIQTALPSNTTLNNILFDYFLFFNQGQLALNDRYVYSYDDFYTLYMHPTGHSLEEWKEEMDSIPLSSNTYNVRHVTCLSRTVPEEKTLIELTFPFLPFSSHDGQIVLYIDQQRLIGLLEPFQLYDDDIAYIETEDGILLASIEPEAGSAERLQAHLNDEQHSANPVRTKIDRQDMLISRYTAGQSHLRLVLARRSARVYARLNAMYRILILSLVIAAFLGMLFSYLFSRRNSTFLRRLVVGSGSQQLNEMSYSKAFQSLRKSFEDIQIANDSMEKALENQQQYLQRSFLTQLLNGDFPNEENALMIARSIPSFRLETPMRIVLLHFSGDSAMTGDAVELQMSVSCLAVIRLSIETLEPDSLRISRSENDYVLLMCGERLEERIEKLVQLIRSNLPEEVNACLFAYVGNPVDRLTDVVRSWDSASSMIYIQPSPAEVPVQYFRENENTRFEIFYPQDLQRRLVSCTMNGDDQGIRDILETLKDRNRHGSSIPTYIAQLLIDSLINTLLQIHTMSGLADDKSETFLSGLTSMMSLPPNDQLDMIDAHFCSLSEAVRKKKTETDKPQIIDDVSGYIREHYMDVNLSLASVADRFHVSESYLSFTFKSQTGINFFSYVEDLRISKAKSLLRETDLKISEIAEQSGYASANSFCRAFKRRTGDSASNYRNQTESS